jgi:hypothetical protein
MTQIETIKVLLYGAPSSGKSMTAAMVFALLKLRGLTAELVRESAKDYVYRGVDMTSRSLELQLEIFTDQLHREKLVDGKVRYLISDSPLLLNAYYSGSDTTRQIAMEQLTGSEIHFWLPKDLSRHEDQGRIHSASDARIIDMEMKNYLRSAGIDLIEADAPLESRSMFVVSRILESA